MGKQGKIHICLVLLTMEMKSIVQNFSTNFGEWPYSCFLYDPTKDENSSDWYIGGATLIAPGVVLTTAHKVE